MSRPSRVHTEDIQNLDLTGRPAEIEISWFANRPIAFMPPDTFPRETLNEIARALVDRGWNQGLRNAEVRVMSAIEQGPQGPYLITVMKARLGYGRIG